MYFCRYFNLTHGYDLLDRASEVTYHDGNTGEETVYGYRNIDDTKTTTQVESISYLDPETGEAVFPKLSYTYNEEGHIISVTPEDGTALEYTYDA